MEEWLKASNGEEAGARFLEGTPFYVRNWFVEVPIYSRTEELVPGVLLVDITINNEFMGLEFLRELTEDELEEAKNTLQSLISNGELTF